MNKNITINGFIVEHCNESMELALARNDNGKVYHRDNPKVYHLNRSFSGIKSIKTCQIGSRN